MKKLLSGIRDYVPMGTDKTTYETFFFDLQNGKMYVDKTSARKAEKGAKTGARLGAKLGSTFAVAFGSVFFSRIVYKITPVDSVWIGIFAIALGLLAAVLTCYYAARLHEKNFFIPQNEYEVTNERMQELMHLAKRDRRGMLGCKILIWGLAILCMWEILTGEENGIIFIFEVIFWWIGACLTGAYRPICYHRLKKQWKRGTIHFDT